jgi:hypothetical protein
MFLPMAISQLDSQFSRRRSWIWDNTSGSSSDGVPRFVMCVKLLAIVLALLMSVNKKECQLDDYLTDASSTLGARTDRICSRREMAQTVADMTRNSTEIMPGLSWTS